MRIVPFILLLALSGFAQSTNPAVNVRAWGDNTCGQTNVPPDLTNAVAISAGMYHSLALRADASVVAWGDNSNGQITVPPNATNVVAVSAGGYHSLALKVDGTVLGWGNNGNGQITVPPNATNVVAIAAGQYSSLALKADGTIVGWGDSYYGEISIPPAATNVVAIATYWWHGLALKADGTVLGWGEPDWGASFVPSTANNVVAIATTAPFSLALKADGTVLGWGNNDSGQITIPPSATNVFAIAAESCEFSLAVRTDGSVVGWGNGYVPPDLPLVCAVSAGHCFCLALLGSPQGTAPPAFLVQPTSQTAAIGSTVTLRVKAVGFPPVRYQWYFGTNAILGATNATLALSDVQSWQSGQYTVVAANGIGPTTSQPAILTVLPALSLDMVPGLRLIGTLGLTYRIEYLNALGSGSAWTTLATVTLTNNPQPYADFSAIGQPQRIYRSVQVP
jgi:hypothetical protein